MLYPAVLLIANLSTVAVVWVGGSRIDSGAMQVGSITAMITYVAQILMAVLMSSFIAMMMPRASVCAGRILEVLDTEPTVAAPTEPVRDLPTHIDVELRGAGFSYPGADASVLRDISFRAEPGTTTAIIGGTGSGKSTLMRLIPRLIDVTDGQVLVSGVDVRRLDPEVLRSRISVVPQKAYLFSGTIADNLRYGRADASDDELWHALEVAQAADFVHAMPDRLESVVSQGGTTVSGGQRQRLAIARALVRKPSIYLFDDAFSALDPATDARLRSALHKVTGQAAVLMVAQRVSSIREADQIIVLTPAASSDVAPIAELLATCPPAGNRRAPAHRGSSMTTTKTRGHACHRDRSRTRTHRRRRPAQGKVTKANVRPRTPPDGARPGPARVVEKAVASARASNGCWASCVKRA